MDVDNDNSAKVVIAVAVNADAPRGRMDLWCVRVALRAQFARGVEIPIHADASAPRTDVIAGGTRLDLGAVNEARGRLLALGLLPDPNGGKLFVAHGHDAFNFLAGLGNLPETWTIYVPEDVISDSPPCPRCAAPSVEILYGEPVSPPRPGEVLGGCVVTDESPRWQCENGHRFGKRSEKE